MSSQRLRIAIVGASPCGHCYAACCKQNGHEFAAILRGDEVRRFAPFAQRVMIADSGRPVIEFVLPYVNARCQFLGADDRCTIYHDRPRACRAFECTPHFNARGVGRHDLFLHRNPRVLNLLEQI